MSEVSQDSPRPAGPFRDGAPSKRSRALVPTLVVLGALIVLYIIFVNLWTDRLWFDSVNFTQVFTTQIATRIGLFLVFGLLMAASVVLNAVLAYRMRPKFRVPGTESPAIERYRVAVDPLRKLVVVGGGTLLGVMAGASAAGHWETFLIWRNGGDFGQVDPQFGVDIGFFAFDFPWWRFVLSFAFAAVVLGLIAAAITHYLYGGVSLQNAAERVTPSAQAHLSVLIGLFILFKAAAYWLDRYELVVSNGSQGTGAWYADVNAVLPAKTIMVFIAVICAVLFFINVWRRNWTLPGIGLGLLLLSAILLGGLWPFLVQQFQVSPSEPEYERPYIERNIKATRHAYDINRVEVADYDATTEVTEGQLADDAGSIPGIRLMDPTVIPPAFQQLQQVRAFYQFSQPLDVDRYEIDDENRDMVVAVREVELDGLSESQRNWANDHTTYTHGYGMVAAFGNERRSDGSPQWAEEDIPSSGTLGEYEPRVYFGENSPEYSIVGAPEGANPVEFDIPEDPDTGERRNSTYAGEGGVPVGGLFNKLLYATKFQEGNILLSDRLNSDSVILYDRHPRDRVEKVAPWLAVDGNPYPSVVDGRVVWILDGYTSLNSYPYSERVSLDDATSDSRTVTAPGVVAQPQDFVNYVRNSVKATVDAYDGTVTLYAWDEEDPVLQAWMSAFPDSVVPRSEISDDLLAHLRYPEDMFKLQRTMLQEYHVTDPNTLYEGNDRWEIPADPAANVDADQPPYYQSIQLPDADQAYFSLTTTYVPRERPNLAAFMTVNADATSDNYGEFTALQLPGNTQINGPGQVANEFESNGQIATELLPLRAGGAETREGNLLTLPVGGGLLYVQPIYVERAAGDSTYPLLRRVLVMFGPEVGVGDTLQGALDQIFQGESGAETEEEGGIVDDATPDEEGQAEPPPTTEPTQPPTEGAVPPEDPGTTPAPGDTLEAALADAQQAWDDAQQAQANGDYAAYGEALQRLDEALERAAALSGQGGG